MIIIVQILLFQLIVVFSGISWQSETVTDHFDKSIFENGKREFVGLSPEEYSEAYDSVYLFVNDQSQAIFYFQHIFTPVCEDNTLCKPVYITLMWDLLGNYMDYRLDSVTPLTKIDHIPFSNEEYQKLHIVLADEHSILSSYSKETITDLYRRSEGNHSLKEVDAITGATPEYIKDQTIEGALYTCHTIWHLCWGNINQMLLKHTKTQLLNQAFIHQLLASDNMHYLEFALKNLNSFETTRFNDEIIEIIRTSDKIIASQVIRYLPKEMVRDRDFNLQLWELFNRAHFLTQKQILGQFSDCQQLPDIIIQELISYAEAAVESQFIQILKIIFNQYEIAENTAELVVEISKNRREDLSGAAAILIEHAEYQHANKELRERILEILEKL